MLIQTPPQINDTISIKLISGEEVIARFDEQTADSIVLSKPMAFMMGPQGLGLVPFMFSVSKDAKITIPLSAVVAQAKTVEDIAKQYIQQTTGLHIA